MHDLLSAVLLKFRKYFIYNDLLPWGAGGIKQTTMVECWINMKEYQKCIGWCIDETSSHAESCQNVLEVIVEDGLELLWMYEESCWQENNNFD